MRLTRLFGPAPAEAIRAETAEPEECAFHLAARSELLFSVFPSGRDGWLPGGEPLQGFAVHATRALDSRLRRPASPRLVGLVGAGGSGKSTLFNQLVGRPASLAKILPHTTRGPVAAAAPGVDLSGLLSPLPMAEAGGTAPVRGELDRALAVRAEGLAGTERVLLDLPDLNTYAAREEGVLTATLLPWLDLALVVFSLESYDRSVLDRSLELLSALGTRRVLVFNRRGLRGPIAPRDLADLEARARDMGAEGPFFVPDTGDPSPARDDRSRLRELVLDSKGDGPLLEVRRRSLGEVVLDLSARALARHEARAGRIEAARAAFRRELDAARERLALDPMATIDGTGDRLAAAMADLRGLVGSPFELFRRLRRGEGFRVAFERTFSVEGRLAQFEEVVSGLSEVPPSRYVERMRDHFRNVASGLAHGYGRLVEEEASLFVDPACGHDLVGLIFEDAVAAMEHGFSEFRDQTVEYLRDQRRRLLGPGSRLESALAAGAFGLLFFDVVMPPVGTLAMVGGSYILARTVGPEVAPLLHRHREFLERSRQGLERSWDQLASGLGAHFMGGRSHLGRLAALPAEDRRALAAWLDRLRVVAERKAG